MDFRKGNLKLFSHFKYVKILWTGVPEQNKETELSIIGNFVIRQNDIIRENAAEHNVQLRVCVALIACWAFLN